ncbi:hypothetical protein HMPREF2975_03510 [Actinomyces sp. HMSC065F12]|nr:hypothetical protein HMPREF2975_03510 [Actinomyces sp. HMSC065F12]
MLAVGVRVVSDRRNGVLRFILDGSGSLWQGERVVAVCEGGSLMCSDPLAPMGVELTYSFNGETVRASRECPTGPHGGVVSDTAGRTVPVDLWEDTGEEETLSNSVSLFNNRVARFDYPKIEGKTRLWLFSPDRVRELHEVVEAQSVLLLVPGCLPMGARGARCVFVKRADWTRTSVDGETRVDVSWQLVDPSGFVEAVTRGGRGAVGVTWGEWERLGTGWQPWSATLVARKVAEVER